MVLIGLMVMMSDDSRLVLLIGLISHKTQQFDSTVT